MSSYDLLEWLRSGGASKSGAVVSEANALRVSAFFACARAIADDVGQLPLKLLQEKPDGSKVPARDRPLYRVVHDRPNAWQTSMGFRGMLCMHAAVGRGGYALITRVRGEVRELLPLPYGAVTQTQGSGWDVECKVALPGGGSEVVKRSDLLKIEGQTWTGLGAYPLIEAAREAVALAMSIEEMQAKLARNGSRPSGLLTTDATLKDANAAKRLREEWGQVYGGAGNTGSVVVLDGGWKFSPMAMTGVDAQHLETRKHQVEEICRVMGVPASRIGYSDKAQTYASAQQFAIDYLRHTIGVWVRRWEEELSAALLTEEEIRAGYLFKFETKGFLRGDDAARAAYYKAGLGTASSPGWLSPNDVRRAEDQDPSVQEGADSIVTVEEFSGRAEAPGEAAPAEAPAGGDGKA